jgi:signal transduction protein with GAF and PtsI domain
VEICSLWLVDEDAEGKKIRLKATQAIDPDYVKDRSLNMNEGVVGFVAANNQPLIVEDVYVKDRSLNMNEGVVGFVAANNQPLIVEDVLKEPRFKEKEMARKLGLVSMVSVPMHVKEDKVIGVLNCFTAKSHSFSETEVNLITTVANQAAVAIFNTELMVKEKVIQEELETRKLVERAKEVLMRRRNMTGEQAYRWMQKRSMDSRKSMRSVAEAVLLSDEI